MRARVMDVLTIFGDGLRQAEIPADGRVAFESTNRHSPKHFAALAAAMNGKAFSTSEMTPA
jgi:hypothetical protein